MGIIDSKIALVTGGVAGIGRTTALNLAEEGAKVVVTNANGGGGEETARAIIDAGGDSMPAIPLMRPMAVVSHNCLVTVRLNALENDGPGASALS